MKRFVAKAFILSLIATLVWWSTQHAAARSAVWLAKALHDLVGYPAPSLAAGPSAEKWWMAPLFPPVVGLVLASHWRSWRVRLVGLILALAAFWYVVAVQISVTYSPYLTLSAVRAYLMQIMISLNSIAIPIVLWLIVCGQPDFTTARSSRATKSRVRSSTGSFRAATGRFRAPTVRERSKAQPAAARSLMVIAALLLALCAVVSAPVQLAVDQTTDTLSAARRRAAGAIRINDYRTALKAIDDMFAQQGPNTALSTLQSHLRNAQVRR